MDRLRHVDRSRRSCREDPRGRARQSAAPHARARVLRSSGVVARRAAHRGDQGPTRPPSGGALRAGLRARLAARLGWRAHAHHADLGRRPAALQPPPEPQLHLRGQCGAPDGKTVYWSVGRSFFRYSPAEGESLAKAKARADSIRADSLKQATKEKPDSVGKARVDSLAKLPAYEGERVDVTIRVPRDVPRGSVVLRGARIVSMKGDELIEKGDLVVTDNRIRCVAATCAAPTGARVIDVAGKTIIPGLIDIHAHPWPTWGIHETEVWKYLANLAWGVTTTRDPQTSTTDVLTYADQVETGDLLGPRIYHTGPGVFGVREHV